MSLFGEAKSSDVTFYCFTPLVSLVTFFIEFALAFFVLFRYKLTLFNKLSVITLICLGTFQLSEYFICTTTYGDLWIKVGYIAITLLPVLGVHSVTAITRKNNFLVASAYVYATLLIAGIIFIPEIDLRTSCHPNYIDLKVSNWFNLVHSFYYAFYVLAGIYMLWNSLKKHVGDANEEKWLLFAYATFLIPSEGLFLLRMISDSAIPLVMCGFAVIAAIILVLIVIPRQQQLELRKLKKKRSRK